jgi:hypothetical protein
MAKQIMASPEAQAQVMDLIGGNADLAAQMAEKLLGSEATRSMVMDKVAGNGEVMQGLMARMARDQSAVDGMIGLAVQDSAMREHVLTLFKGMQMAGR